MVDTVLPAELESLTVRIATALQREAMMYTAVGVIPPIALAGLKFTCVTDPANQLPGYQGIWRNARNERCGSLNLNSDGSFYAEYDLFCPHPVDAESFVEMVSAWATEIYCDVK